MKILFTAIFIVLFPHLSISQDSARSVEGKDEKVYHVVDVMPLFPGGESELLKFISRNYRFPKSAAKDQVKGKILIQFVINESGDVEDVKIIRGLREDVDSAAIDLINSMPKWKPGLVGNRPVKVTYNLPINL